VGASGETTRRGPGRGRAGPRPTPLGSQGAGRETSPEPRGAGCFWEQRMGDFTGICGFSPQRGGGIGRRRGGMLNKRDVYFRESEGTISQRQNHKLLAKVKGRGKKKNWLQVGVARLWKGGRTWGE